jgi:DNA-binding NarL/FixJ family response regulator
MATPFSVSIMGDDRVVTEALSIALRTRGLLATVISDRFDETSTAAPRPQVLILISHESRERARVQLATAQAALPETSIIILGRGKDQELRRYVLDNVAGCLPTADSFENLVRTLEMLRYPGPLDRIAELPDSIGRLTAHPLGSDSDLTTREQDVFRSISAGLSNKEIANLYSISTSTVKNHVHSIVTKLNIRRRRYALGRTYVPRIPVRRAISPSRHTVGAPEVANRSHS